MSGTTDSISNKEVVFFWLQAFSLGYKRGVGGNDGTDGVLLPILQAMIPRATIMGCRRFFFDSGIHSLYESLPKFLQRLG